MVFPTLVDFPAPELAAEGAAIYFWPQEVTAFKLFVLVNHQVTQMEA